MISDARAKATANSIMDYIHKATPTVIRDLYAPVGNNTGQHRSLLLIHEVIAGLVHWTLPCAVAQCQCHFVKHPFTLQRPPPRSVYLHVNCCPRLLLPRCTAARCTDEMRALQTLQSSGTLPLCTPATSLEPLCTPSGPSLSSSKTWSSWRPQLSATKSALLVWWVACSAFLRPARSSLNVCKV